MKDDRWTLGLCALALALSFVLSVDDSGRAARLAGIDLPAMCAHKILTGSDCPGCGLIRSFIFLSHGRVDRAFALNPAGPLLYVLAWLQIPYRILTLHRRVPPAERPRALRWVSVLAIASLLAGWLTRLALGG